MKTKLPFILFVALTGILFLVALRPAYMSEITLRGGELYKFSMRPVDPADPFRGRYVALDFTQSTAPLSKSVDSVSSQTVYGSVVVDSTGFAVIDSIYDSRPRGKVAIKLTHNSRRQWWFRRDSSTIRFDFPFDKFFMTEKLAPVAERIYRRESRSASEGSYLAVRILNGNAVIEELYMKGIPIAEASRKALKEKK